MLQKLKQLDWQSHSVVLSVAVGLLAAWLLYPRPTEISTEAEEAAPDADGVTEIVYWTPSAATDQQKAGIEAFEQRYPQYRVVMGTATTRDAVGDPTRFLLGVAGGVPPDLMYFDRFAIVEWASRGAFFDLTGWIERDRDKPDGILKENYYGPVWNEPVYKDRVYAIGNSVDTRALYFLRDPLIRAGFVYKAGDPEVQAGKAEPGEARPPKTWEEICRKRLHANGVVDADGRVELTGLVRRPAVNADAPEDAAPDLLAAGVRTNDVVALVQGNEVFRARVAEIEGSRRLKLDLMREQRPGLKSLPAKNTGQCEVKVFDQDGYMPRLTRYDPESGLMSQCAFLPLYGNSWLYLYGWLNGASFMDEDGTECLLDTPRVVEALQYMVDLYDCLGGREAANVFQASAEAGGSTALDPMLAGKIVMRIDGDWYLQTIVAFKPELNFGVTPSPIPEHRLRAGHGSLGWTGGWAYSIPATARRKEAAWVLLKWLASFEANKVMEDFQASLNRARGQVYFPRLHPDRRVLEWLKEKYLYNNPAVSENLIQAYDAFSELLPRSKYRPVTPVGQKLWNEHVRAAEAATNHTKTPYEALSYGTRQVQAALERVLHPPTGPPINWHLIIGLYVAGVIAFFAGLAIVQERKRRRFGGERKAWLEGFVCAGPWLTGFLVFGAGPIIFSIVISFSSYDVLNPARFIGLTNYVQLVGRHYDDVLGRELWNDPLFWKSLGNTLFMVIGVPLGILAGLALALLLDTRVRGLHVFRTVYYLPAIVPAVASFILWLWIFDPSRGLLNQTLRIFGIDNPPYWLQDPGWAKPALILMGLWGVGGSMIIWLAGLKDIPESLYEAAAIDGANRRQRLWFITIPLLSPYILFNLIMGLIGVFQIFEAAFIMTAGGPADATLFYAYKLFNEAFRYLNMGVASAMAWILFVVVLAITLFQLWLSKKWVHYGGSN